MKYDFEKELDAFVKKTLSAFRYEHTVSVVNECKELAKIYPCDERSLVIAAYLHDITKETPFEKQLELVEEMNVHFPADSLISPKTAHAFSAPAFVKKYLKKYYSRKIADIIALHTTGSGGMTLEEKLLYLADYIEPTRKFEDCVKVRRMFYSKKNKTEKHLDRVILRSLIITVNSLIKEKRPVHSYTVDAYNSLLEDTEIIK